MSYAYYAHWYVSAAGEHHSNEESRPWHPILVGEASPWQVNDPGRVHVEYLPAGLTCSALAICFLFG